MILVTSNKHQRLLCLHYVQQVTPVELENAREQIKVLLTELPPNLHLLVDMSQLESMDSASTTEIGRAMDMFDQHGVGLIVRVIPDGSKDIGLSILSIFHYPHRPRIITSRTLAEALQKLSQWA